MTGADGVGCVLLEDGKHICSYKGSDLASGCCDAIVLAANRGCAAFGGTQADVVAGAQFAQRDEDSIWSVLSLDMESRSDQESCDLPKYYHKTSNVLCGRQVPVTAGHDEPDDALQTNPKH